MKKIKRISIIVISILSILIIICTSCNKIDEKEITIIDDIVLGKPSNTFYNYLDSIGIPSKAFFTRPFFTSDEKNILENRIKLYYTNQFNFTQYKNDKSDHFGFYYQILDNNNNNVGLIVMIGSVMPTVIINSQGDNISFIDDNVTRGGINQSVCVFLLDDILYKLESKYGKGTKIEKESNPLYLIKGSNVETYQTGIDSLSTENVRYDWKTQYINISFCYGIPDPNTWFIPETNIYYWGKFNYMTGTHPMKCNYGASITYQLNNKAMKELGFDKNKI